MATIGNHEDALAALHLHYGEWDEVPYIDEWQQIGQGSHRTVYLCPDGDVVYKIGHNSVNRFEVKQLQAARDAGKDYAPEATLWTLTYQPPSGDEPEETTVVAMPYLPEDESVPYEGRPAFPEACDFNDAGNVVANGGRLWLIDAGGL
jgi:hypothetical protein